MWMMTMIEHYQIRVMAYVYLLHWINIVVAFPHPIPPNKIIAIKQADRGFAAQVAGQ